MATAILIVNYRTYPELERCLVSLAPVLRPGDQVAIVDYESDPVALSAAVRVCPRAVLLPRTDNRGFAAGVNLAARATDAPFLLLVNPDSVVEGPLVAFLEDWMVAHPDAGVVGPRVLNADGSVQPSARKFPDWTTWLGGRTTWLTARFPDNPLSRRNLVGRDSEGALDVDWLSGACQMTRRDAFERVGGFDEGFFMYWEDADYCRRIAAAGLRRVYLPGVCIRHLTGRSAEHAPAAAVRAFHRSAYRLYWKQASVVGRVLAPLVRAGLWLRGEFRARSLS